MGNAYGNKTKNIQGLVIHDGEKISNGANISGLHFPFRRSQWPFIPRHTPSLFFELIPLFWKKAPTKQHNLTRYHAIYQKETEAKFQNRHLCSTMKNPRILSGCAFCFSRPLVYRTVFQWFAKTFILFSRPPKKSFFALKPSKCAVPQKLDSLTRCKTALY